MILDDNRACRTISRFLYPSSPKSGSHSSWPGISPRLQRPYLWMMMLPPVSAVAGSLYRSPPLEQEEIVKPKASTFP